MDASILVVGCETFLASILKTLCDVTNSTVEVAAEPSEAVPLIQAQQPDLLILQANQSGSLDLCQRIKEQSRLSWIYCLVLEDCVADANPTTLIPRSLEAEIKALESGADAYLSIRASQVDSQPSGVEPDDLLMRLLQAYIQVGLRRVHNHRELMRANDVLSAIALSDPLTELNNRRAFEWELPRQIHNARDRNMPISLMMLDVDFFKTINDTYGHLVGDRALQLLATRLRHNLRFYDTPFRYGGEEFVIILSDTGCTEANLVAHRICCLIADQPFVIDETLDLQITVSAGTASLLPEDDARGISLLRRADQNLLTAKSQGRNRVVSEGKG
ncbi:diguanylate cyclase [Oscillatoria sp. FACHB-1407]|uniref:GGDEF domain-containing response regulator n=1 Tax=Oscillatoria sp. FACHB-1407 TaxID=2692847 RepID=UPI001688C4E5|nr:diguanylate cyclase [Oscillatoria sp. FACHB-1407]MBD2460104.1 diguanylate cyclase [Oscillatoria sp. FACHB-1407]